MADQQSSERAVAFNAGSDARLAGAPPGINPYQRSHQQYEHDAWDAGYRDVDKFWGVDAKWPVKRLPVVLGEG